MARGNERRAIFRDDKDRERFSVRVQAYYLMPNHYRLVVWTPLGDLSPAMGWLPVNYTVRFNRRWRGNGVQWSGWVWLPGRRRCGLRPAASGSEGRRGWGVSQETQGSQRSNLQLIPLKNLVASGLRKNLSGRAF